MKQHPPVHQLVVLSTGWCGISHLGTEPQFNLLTLTFGLCILFLLLVVFFPTLTWSTNWVAFLPYLPTNIQPSLPPKTTYVPTALLPAYLTSSQHTILLTPQTFMTLTSTDECSIDAQEYPKLQYSFQFQVFLVFIENMFQ